MGFLQKSKYSWDYYTEKTDLASKGFPKGSYWPRGKLLGGTGAINAMIYVRGNRKDYNHWEELGNPTWGWDNVLNYFKKSQDLRNEYVFEVFGESHHSRGGPLKVDMYHSMEPIKTVIYEAAFELGFKEIFDANAEEHIGYHTCMGTLDKGTRCSPAKAFLVPAKNRPNLHIIKNAHVTKINVSPKNVVTSVDFIVKDSQKLTATIKKEVILSAGAINSPQILMLSGIGPKAELKKHNIPLKADLPVGENLQDHAIVPIFFTFHKSTATNLDIKELADYLYMYVNHKIGPFAALGATDLIGFVNTVNDTDPFPDVQYHHFMYKKQTADLKIALDMFGFDDRISASISKGNHDQEVLCIFVTLLNPKSIGNIKLKSSDPFDAPVINANYLKEQEDVETFIRGIRILLKMLTTKTFESHEGKELHIDIPECDAMKTNSNEYWECYVRYMTTTIYHPIGTAKMGPASDPEAVVDSRLRVNGVKGLRVIDASIMPTIPSGNTNAPTIMVGEKGSDMIKEDWAITNGGHTEL